MAILLWAASLAAGVEPGAAAPLLVSLDFSALNEQQFASLHGLALERRLVVRLVQEGFAVVGGDERADVRVLFRPNAQGTEVSAQGATISVSRILSSEADVAAHLEIVQKVVELVRAASARPGPSAKTAVQPRAPRCCWVAGHGGAALFGSAEPALDVRAAYDAGADLGGLPMRPVLAVSGWHNLDSTMHVLEWQTELGVQATLALVGDLELLVGALTGVRGHRFMLDSPLAVAEPRGQRMSWVVSGNATLSYPISDRFAAELSADVSWSQVEWQHVYHDQTVWVRPPFRLLLAAGMAWRFGPAVK